MRVILTYGTFDLFHIGHVRLLERAKACGDRLIVGVSTDNFNALKGKKSIIPYEHRAAIVNAMGDVNQVFAEEHWEQKITDIKKFNVDALIMGDDWRGKFDYLSEFCDVCYIPRTSGISSTQLRKTLRPFSPENVTDMKNSIATLQCIIEQLNA